MQNNNMILTAVLAQALLLVFASPVSACYIVSYDCTVTCLNGDLNTTELANNTIKSVGNIYGDFTDRCSITCGEGMQDSGWATTHNEPLDNWTVDFAKLLWNSSLFIVGVLFGILIHVTDKKLREKQQ